MLQTGEQMACATLALALTAHEGTVRAVVAPVAAGEERPALNAAAVRGLLAQAGYADWEVLDSAIALLLAHWANQPEGCEIELAVQHDAHFDVGVALDALQAWVQVYPARGGKALQPAEVVQGLHDAGVVYGIDAAAVQQACQATSALQLEVARGQPAVNGHDALFEVLVNTVHDRRPTVDEHGMIDFRELGSIPFVAPGTPLMRRVAASAGTPGMDVRGNPIMAQSGRDYVFASPLKGVRPSADDPNVLEADTKGQPVAVERGMVVEDALSLEAVDLDSGNIDFDGSIEIKGDVLAGMRVQVSGNIVIGGTVEGAHLVAGGDIQVRGGIIAGTTVQAEGQVACKFTENAHITAGTVISVDDMAMQSQLYALNQVLVGVKSTQRGRLVGGTTRAAILVRAPQIGSDMSGVTAVQVGVNPRLDGQLADLQAQIAKLNTHLGSLTKIIHTLKTNDEKSSTLQQAQASLLQAQRKLADLLRDKTELEQQLALCLQARIEVGQEIQGSVTIAFGKRVRRLEQPYGAGRFELDAEGAITHIDRRGVSSPVV